MRKVFTAYSGVCDWSLTWARWIQSTPSSEIKHTGFLCLLHAGILLGLLFNHDYGGSMFLRNVGWLLPQYTVLYLRRWTSDRILQTLIMKVLPPQVLINQAFYLSDWGKPRKISVRIAGSGTNAKERRFSVFVVNVTINCCFIIFWKYNKQHSCSVQFKIWK
jgi:hypothetical protein